MAINFPSGSLSSNGSNVYRIEKFNGVDYTSTPTLIDESRAMDISNYLPNANFLQKRNGWEVIHDLTIFNNQKYVLKNIWQVKFPKQSKTYYIALVYQTETKKCSLLKSENLELGFNFTVLQHANGSGFSEYVENEEDIYFYGVAFENKFFMLLCEKYIFVYYDEDAETIKFKYVKENAYIPTIITGLDSLQSGGTSLFLQEFNLLSNKCYIEIIINDKEENNVVNEQIQTFDYNIGQFFSEDKGKIKYSGGFLENGDSLKDIAEIQIDFDETKKILKLKKVASWSEGILRAKLLFEFDNSNSDIIEGMRFGIPYGTKGYKDRLFLSGNPKYPNMDVHSCGTNATEGWLDYTYFGDSSYQFFGSDNTKILGYGILNNGTMAILKESSQFEPNLYIRSSEFRLDQNNNYIETFPVEISGIHIEIPKTANIINYKNNLLLNIPSGIYKINITTSTATQSYEALEMSYYIRNNLGNDLTNSAWCVYKNKLYVSRLSADGKRRIYVADEDRYSYIDNVRVYEWFVLDEVEAEQIYVFDDVMYFSNKIRGLCRFGKEFFDSYTEKITDVSIMDGNYSNGLFINSEDNLVILDIGTNIIKTIMESNNKYEAYLNLKDNTKISFANDIKIKFKFEDLSIAGKNTESSSNRFTKMELKVKTDNVVFLEYVRSNNLRIIIPFLSDENGSLIENVYTMSSLDFDGTRYIINIEIAESGEYLDGSPYIFDKIEILLPKGTIFTIKEIYELNNSYPFSNCKIENNVWKFYGYDSDGIYAQVEIGGTENTYFNQIALSLEGMDVDFEWLEGSVANGVSFHFSVPINSYWLSKYHDLGRLDYLKTIENIIFVANDKNGGYTDIGYRTSKNEVSYQVKELTGINFNDFDFNSVFFGAKTISKTHTSKKKIKNFSFVQIIFKSSYIQDSTIVSLALRYKYSRLNKGVK